MFWSPSLSDVKKGVKSDIIIGYRQINKKNCVNAKKEKNRTERNHKKDCQCKDDVEMNNKKEQEEKEKDQNRIKQKDKNKKDCTNGKMLR